MSIFQLFETRTLVEEHPPIARPGPLPEIRLNTLQHPTLVVRQDSSSTSSGASSATTSCGPNDTTGICQRYVASDPNQTTLPIVLGVVIPVVGALVLFIILHRRHVKKLRKEDINDAHKSLDFGLDPAVVESEKRKRGKKGLAGPEMSLNEAKDSVRRHRGMSMDMDMENPYILPHGLQSSRESLHSLSRSINADDDKYRPTGFIPRDGSPYPASLRSPMDDASSFTGSSRRRIDIDGDQSLLRHAQRNSRSMPQSRSGSMEQSRAPAGSNNLRKPLPITKNGSLAPGAPDATRESFMSTTSSVGPNAAIRASNNYLAAYIRGGGDSSSDKKPEPPSKEPTINIEEVVPVPGSAPPEIQVPVPAAIKDKPSDRRDNGPIFAELADNEIPANKSTMNRGQAPQEVFQEPTYASQAQELPAQFEREPKLPEIKLSENVTFEDEFRMPEVDLNGIQKASEPRQPLQSLENSRLSQQQSKLPDVELPAPEHYTDPVEYEYDDDDEYYDVSTYEDYLDYDPHRLTMGMRPLPPDDPSENPEQRANRIRSFYKEYFDETKPNGNSSRQEYYDGSENFAYDNYGYQNGPEQYPYQNHMQARNPYAYPPRGPSRFTGPERHRATVSSGSYRSGPRAFSSASGQYGVQGRRPPKKHLPPPKPLYNLPTPHLLKDDNFLPIDFAPPKTYKDRRAGTPDSFLGELRPYSPGPRAHIPLASSFDDLSVMPSPHQLRASGTFNNLDFAPPPRFKSGDTASDAGSIRSNRSAVSARQVHNIRAGAYRISRIPKEVAGTKEEMTDALRPQWSLVNK